MSHTPSNAVRTIGSKCRAYARALLTPLRWGLNRAALKMSPTKRISGFEVVDMSIAEHDAVCFDRVAKVLDLIQRVDPRRFRRMSRDVRRILITHTGGAAGSYWSDLDACALDAQHLLGSLESAAMTLVHEATHARLRRAGFSYTPELRPRLERLCLEAEIAFGERLPNSSDLIAEAQHALNSPWWSDDASNQRQAQQLRTLGWPEWSIRLRNALLRR